MVHQTKCGRDFWISTKKGREYMDDMQVYIANLGKYNEGELVGAWFTFPIDFE